MRSLLGGGPKADVELEVDSPFVFFHEDPSNTQTGTLAGRVVIIAEHSAPVRSIKLTLSGTRRMKCAAVSLRGAVPLLSLAPAGTST